MNNPGNSSIGVFDSGVGGLSVLKSIHEQLPNEELIYFADQAHVPYGSRSLNEVAEFSFSITDFLLSMGVKMVVVACNTASAAALQSIRKKFPKMLIVGVEPAVKPAVENTETGKIGVLATPATFQGALYASVVERFGKGVSIIQRTCPGLVELIEKGDLSSGKVDLILEDALHPMIAEGIDSIVLGCTHYPFVLPAIQKIVGEDIRVIDPAPAIARQVGRLLITNNLLHENIAKASVLFITSGDQAQFRRLLPKLYGTTGIVKKATWEESKLRLD